MKTKLLSALLFVCILYSCSPDQKEIIEPEQPPIDNPERPDDTEQPNKPDIPKQPEEPQKPSKIKEIININNKYMIIGTNDWYAITYGNKKYVAVGDNMFTTTSIDGENWTINAKELSPQSTWNDGTFGNGKFVVINGETGNKHIATSTDGKNWSIKVVGTSYFKCIAFGDGKFIATNYYKNLFTSTDGENWTQLDNLPFEANDIIFMQ